MNLEFFFPAKKRFFCVIFGALSAAGLMLFAPLASKVSASAQLLFKSGFESGTILETLSGPSNPSVFQHFSGIDQSAGSAWPINLWGTNPVVTGLHLITYNTNGQDVNKFIKNQLVTIAGPAQTPTRALEMMLYDPNSSLGCCAQDVFQLSGLSSPPAAFYERFWLKLDAEAQKQCEARPGEFWRYLFGIKTNTDFRIAAMIYPYGQSGCGSWYVKADDGVINSPTATYWTGENRTVPVPWDQWFPVEIYLNRGTPADRTAARFFLGINGQAAIDVRGDAGRRFYGANNEDINLITLSSVYGNTSYPAGQWLDDLEIWDSPPCAALPCGGSASGADTVPPSVPAGLAAAAVSSSQINLSWVPSTDNIGVAGYRVYRNGSQVAEVSGASYQDANLPAAASYAYTVSAYDQAGNASAQSGSVSATTPAAVSAPVISGVMAGNLTASSAAITWLTDQPADSQVEYGRTLPYGLATVLYPTLAASHSVSLSGLSPASLYHYRVRSKDDAGNLAVSADQTFATPATSADLPQGPWTGRYYSSTGKKTFGSLKQTRSDSAINFDWGTGSPAAAVPAENFAVRWSASLNFPYAGIYSFTTQADDGIRVWIDNRLVLDKWYEQVAAYRFDRNLAAGYHLVRVEYFEKTGSAQAKLSWVLGQVAGLHTSRLDTNLSRGFGLGSPEVFGLQQRLYDLGLLDIAPTGNFGLRTEEAVKKFQRLNGLPQTGIVGPQTRSLLK